MKEKTFAKILLSTLLFIVIGSAILPISNARLVYDPPPPASALSITAYADRTIYNWEGSTLTMGWIPRTNLIPNGYRIYVDSSTVKTGSWADAKYISFTLPLSSYKKYTVKIVVYDKDSSGNVHSKSDTAYITYVRDGDNDLDGLYNVFETRVSHTDPCDSDSDNDGLFDNQEWYGTTGYYSDPNKVDTDGDGLTDYQEVMGTFGYITNPRDTDSDDDSISDYTEYIMKTNPRESEFLDGFTVEVELTLGTTAPASFFNKFRDTDGNYHLPRSLYAFVINRMVDARKNNYYYCIENLVRISSIELAVVDKCEWWGPLNHGVHCREIARKWVSFYDILGVHINLFDYDNYGGIEDTLFKCAKEGYDVISVSDLSYVSKAVVDEIVNVYGVTLVCGTGNLGLKDQIHGISQYRNVICVGGSNFNKRWQADTMGSNYGKSNYDNGVDLVADCLSIDAFTCRVSWAVPKVARTLQYMLVKNPLLNPQTLREILRSSTVQINYGLNPGEYDYADNSPANWPLGWDEEVGYGLLDTTTSYITARDYWN